MKNNSKQGDHFNFASGRAEVTQASLPLGSAGLRVEAVVAGIRSDPAFAPASFVSSGQLAFTDVDVATGQVAS